MTRRMLDPDLSVDDHDDFDKFLEENLQDPAFAAAYEDAAQRSRLVADLVACRKVQKLVQRDVAGHMGVGQSVVSEFETSMNGDTYLSTLQRYARAIGAHLRIRIEMPADQNWAAHVGRSYSQREGATVRHAVVKKPESPWLETWVHEARVGRNLPTEVPA